MKLHCTFLGVYVRGGMGACPPKPVGKGTLWDAKPGEHSLGGGGGQNQNGSPDLSSWAPSPDGNLGLPTLETLIMEAKFQLGAQVYLLPTWILELRYDLLPPLPNTNT